MKQLLAKESFSIKKSLRIMTKHGSKCLIVVDEKNKLLGTLSGGDLRRAILNGIKLGSLIKSFYNKKPAFFEKNKF